MKRILKMLTLLLFFLVITNFAFAQGGVQWPTSTGLPTGSIARIVSNFTNWLLIVFGFIAIISFIVSGIMYFMSTGNTDMQEKAKKAFIYSIIGVIIALSGLIIIYSVDYFLRGSAPSGGGGVGRVKAM